MKITLNSSEITQALRSYINQNIRVSEDKECTIDVSTSRGVGLVCEITISDKVPEAKPEPVEDVKEETKRTAFGEAPKSDNPFFEVNKTVNAIIDRVEAKKNQEQVPSPEPTRKSIFSSMDV